MQQYPNIKLTKGIHRGNSVIFFKFKYHKVLVSFIKNLPKTRWSQSKRIWYIDEKHFSLNEVFKHFKGKVFINYSELKFSSPPDSQNAPCKIEIPAKYLMVLKTRNYSKKTIEAYTYHFRNFVQYYKNKNLDELTSDDINWYLFYIVENEKPSESKQNQIINAIKFYYEKVLGRSKEYYKLIRPKRPKKLPDVLSESEIKRLLEVIENIKHKVAVSMLYSTGIRRGELINLKLEDIERTRRMVKVRGGKGNKDRYSTISLHLIKLIDKYLSIEKPRVWLLEGPAGKQYSAESVTKIVSRAAGKAGITKNVTPHILRHSFATHLLEHGTDTRYIQDLLGHVDPKTTQIYTRVSKKNIEKIPNPLDNIWSENSQ